MNTIDKLSRFLLHHGSQVLLVGLAGYGLAEYIDFNKGFDYVIVFVFLVLTTKEAFSEA